MDYERSLDGGVTWGAIDEEYVKEKMSDCYIRPELVFELMAKGEEIPSGFAYYRKKKEADDVTVPDVQCPECGRYHYGAHPTRTTCPACLQKEDDS